MPLSRAKASFLEALGTFGIDRTRTAALAETFPASDPTTEQAPGGHPQPEQAAVAVAPPPRPRTVRVSLDGEDFELTHGAVVIAAITSCTNTSNPR